MWKLPIDGRGYPVPKFVWRKEDGTYDFRVVEPGWLFHCIRHKTCWLCGEPLGRNMVFVVGPMCVVNRASGEPPCHLECARYAAQACPFMVRPHAKRRQAGIDEIVANGGGFNPAGLERNPGATALYITGNYRWLSDVKVIRMGAPDRVEWWAEGRAATRAEIERSIETGKPLLMKDAQVEGPAAVRELERLLKQAEPLLPSA